MKICILCFFVMFSVEHCESIDTCHSMCLCLKDRNGIAVDCYNRNLGFIPSFPNNTYSILLRHDRLSMIEVGTFDNLPSLKTLDLGNNNLSIIGNTTFDSLESLETLDLSYNQLSAIQTGLFDSLQSIRVLYLHYNQIERLDNGVFRNLLALQELYLYNNKLSAIEEGVFYNLTILWRLHLQNNQIERLDDEAFRNLSALQELWLNGNPLRCDCFMLPFYEWVKRRKFTSFSANCKNGTQVMSIQRAEFNRCHYCLSYNCGLYPLQTGGNFTLRCKDEWVGNGCQAYTQFKSRENCHEWHDG